MIENTYPGGYNGQVPKTYYPTIGLEVHVELNTKSKMFCGCKNDPDEERPNTNICPICMGHPGTLPVANKKAIESVIRVGLSLGSKIADFTEFDRKNYFYPDIPKGYQISQYKYPVVSGGALNGFAITRVHIEEDTGLSKHDRGNFSLVDYNRAGVPLMELVTEPVLHTAKDAGDFARELQLLLRTLGVSNANLEKGEMRVEPNISISDDPDKFGTKIEVKNLNSFRSVERAIEYEFARMQALYEAGRQDEIIQETRGWDENKQTTFSQRSKEDAHDYRYFPDPDLSKMQLHRAFSLDEMKGNLPELPWERRTRYLQEGLSEEQAEIFVQNTQVGDFYERVPSVHKQLVANYIISSGLTQNFPNPDDFGKVVNMAESGKLTSSAAKEVLIILATEGGNPEKIVTERGLLQKSSEEDILPFVKEVIGENEKVVADYKSGKEAALQSLVGQVMKKSKGSANPGVVLKILKEML